MNDQEREKVETAKELLTVLVRSLEGQSTTGTERIPTGLSRGSIKVLAQGAIMELTEAIHQQPSWPNTPYTDLF